MTSIRMVSVLALTTVISGCVGTQPSVVTAPITSKSDTATVAQSKPDTAPGPVLLPETMAQYKPVASVPAQPVVIAQSQPSEMVNVGPLDRPVVQQVYEKIEVVEPAYETIEVVAATPEPQPEITPVYIPAIPEPVEVSRESSWGASAEPTYAAPPAYEVAVVAPAYEAAVPTARGMSPIYDDPAGSQNDNSEARIHAAKTFRPQSIRAAGGPPPNVRSAFTPAFGARLEQAALGRLNPGIRYDARYIKIGYPWGDVPDHTGVCTDVIIRSYRSLGIDLQQLVHEDMRHAFKAYPSRRIYGLKSADPNIDHRRVVNLEAFFERTGASIPVGTSPDDFQPGDILTWRLSGNEPHIGIVVADRDRKSGYPMVVHNLGAGVRKDDLITIQTPVGHYRFAPDTDTRTAQLTRKTDRTGG